MPPQSELEIKGNFLSHPFAELLVEVAQARINGSLRVSDKDKKCVVYFKNGNVVFAVSNARSTRLFEMLLRNGKLTKESLVQIPNFANDFEFSSYLKANGILTGPECDSLITEQIQFILIEILSWRSGDWIFSSLARIRDGLAYEINTNNLVIDFGRSLPTDVMLSRFRSFDENFTRSRLPETELDLTRSEAFVLSRSEDGPLTARGLLSIAAMSESEALHAIYVLWLAGLLIRNDWQAAIPRESIAAMKGAKLVIKTEVKKRDLPIEADKTKPVETSVAGDSADKQNVAHVAITIDEYLERIANAKTYYDILGVDIKSEAEELKQAYFFLAKNFHPDRYHSEGGKTLRRIQSAFTELAQAHETLKNPESREIYDYRMRKELAERERFRGTDDGGKEEIKVDQAAEYFDRGYDLMIDEDIDGALPFLARAVHFDSKNARYHAFYGKALSFIEEKRHKAEAELQTALKIDPNNPKYRIMLVEFYIKFNLVKRAEGELTRLLAVVPNNREAQDLLASLKK